LGGISFAGVIEDTFFKAFHIQNLHLNDDSRTFFLVIVNGCFYIYIGIFNTAQFWGKVGINDFYGLDFVLTFIEHGIEKAD
jgi:hypothetical protein